MTVLQHDAVVADAHFGEVFGPRLQRIAVGYGEGQVVQGPVAAGNGKAQ